MLTQEILNPLSHNPSVGDTSDVKCVWSFCTNNQLAYSQAPAESVMIHFNSATQNLHLDPTGEGGLRPTKLPLQKRGKGWVCCTSEQPHHVERFARVAGIIDYYPCLLYQMEKHIGGVQEDLNTGTSVPLNLGYTTNLAHGFI